MRSAIRLILIFVGSVLCSPEVKQTTSRYSCCDWIKFDGSCENVWSMKGKNFAQRDGKTKDCISPCKTIEDERIILEACVNFTQTTFCTSAGKTKETRTNYLSQTCQFSLSSETSPGVQGAFVFMLLVLIGWTLLSIC